MVADCASSGPAGAPRSARRARRAASPRRTGLTMPLRPLPPLPAGGVVAVRQLVVLDVLPATVRPGRRRRIEAQEQVGQEEDGIIDLHRPLVVEVRRVLAAEVRSLELEAEDGDGVAHGDLA